MPAKTKVTKEMIIDAAFDIARNEGIAHVNARTVSYRLACSTQPVMYHFATIEDLKRTVYEKADRYHTEYLMHAHPQQDIMLTIGLNFIRFAVAESNLFRLLFQSGFAQENNFLEMVNAEQLIPVLSAMQEAMELTLEQTKDVFITLALFVYGYASILVNDGLEYDEELIKVHLVRAYNGARLAIQEEMKE